MSDLDFGEQTSIGNIGYKIIGRKSWVAYVGTILRYLITFGVLYFVEKQLVMFPQFFRVNEYILFIYGIIGVVFLYKIAVLRSNKISVTDEGIWLNSGILPWAKGGNGIRWNDADMAFYSPNFLSWITNSYTIQVNHKYTNKTDFRVASIWRGRKVCGEISEIQRQRLGA